MYACEWGEAKRLAQTIVTTSVTALGVAALLIAVVTTPAIAKKKPKPVEKQTETFVDQANGEPLMLVVSLREQKLDLYRGLTLITSSRVSTGTATYPTKSGVFSILEKRRYHHSNMYSAAPMPWMQRLTWSGTALHAGVVPGYPASHGCIRLRFSFAPKLYDITTGGENVIVANDRPVPKLVEHPALFQPLMSANGGPKPEATASNDMEAKPSEKVMGPNSIGGANSDASLAHQDTTQSLAGSHAYATAAIALTGGDGINSAAINDAPLRILVTRRTDRDRIISVQYLLSWLGYLAPQKFSGRLGNATVTAIKAFQKANGMPETGAFSADLAKKVYEVAGKDEPPDAHLFLRQNFKAVFDTPVAIRDPDRMLGMHVFTATFAPGERNARWMVISLEGDAVAALDRVEIPDDIRTSVGDKLTPGSSLIISDESKNSAILPEGGDYIVLAKSTPAVVEVKSKPKAKRVAVAKPKARSSKKWKRTIPAYAHRDFRSFDQSRRSFFRWRWQR